jgi:hypothetical protein
MLAWPLAKGLVMLVLLEPVLQPVQRRLELVLALALALEQLEEQPLELEQVLALPDQVHGHRID